MDVDDLLVDILVRLPVSSLLRFKSVRKSWYAHIVAPDFVHRHATFEDKSKLGTFLFQYGGPEYKRSRDGITSYVPHLFTLSGDQLEVRKDLDVPLLQLGYENQFAVRKNLDFPLLHNQYVERGVYMLGSCHGIILLREFSYSSSDVCDDSWCIDLFLCNPATKQIRILPKSLMLPSELGCEDIKASYALGFDVKAKDYKVLKISKFRTGYPCRAQVYSLNANSWRYIDIDPAKLCDTTLGCHDQGQYLNGKYYSVWTNNESGSRRKRETVIAFDFSEETFRTLLIMNYNDRQVNHLASCLQSIGEKVAYITKYLNVYNNYHVHEIWVMNDRCRKDVDEFESAPSTRLCTTIYIGHCDLIAISKNGKIGLIWDGDRKTLQTLDLVTQEAKNLLCVDRTCSTFRADVYKESLASVCLGN